MADYGKAVCCPTRNATSGNGWCEKHDPIKLNSGLQKKLKNELEAMHATTVQLEGFVTTAKDILRKNLARYAAMHLEGAEIAARKGDTRPAEWALQHAKDQGKTAVEPPQKAASDTGVKVFLGIQMGAVPETTTAKIISYADGEEVPSEDTNE